MKLGENLINNVVYALKCILYCFNVRSYVCIWSNTAIQTSLIVVLITEVEKQFVWGAVWKCVHNN